MEKQQKVDLIMALLNGMKPREANEILSECMYLVMTCTELDATTVELSHIDGMRSRPADKSNYGKFITTKVNYERASSPSANYERRIGNLEKRVERLMRPANTFSNGEIDSWQKLARFLDCGKK